MLTGATTTDATTGSTVTVDTTGSATGTTGATTTGATGGTIAVCLFVVCNIRACLFIVSKWVRFWLLTICKRLTV